MGAPCKYTQGHCDTAPNHPLQKVQCLPLLRCKCCRGHAACVILVESCVTCCVVGCCCRAWLCRAGLAIARLLVRAGHMHLQ